MSVESIYKISSEICSWYQKPWLTVHCFSMFKEIIDTDLVFPNILILHVSIFPNIPSLYTLCTNFSKHPLPIYLMYQFFPTSLPYIPCVLWALLCLWHQYWQLWNTPDPVASESTWASHWSWHPCQLLRLMWWRHQLPGFLTLWHGRWTEWTSEHGRWCHRSQY